MSYRLPALRALSAPSLRWMSAVSLAALLAACGEESAPDQLAKAKASLKESERDKAVVLLKGAVQADPKLAEARFLLGKTLLELGDAGGAQIELKKAQEAGVSEDEVLPLMAQAQLARGEFDRLIADHANTDLKSPSAQADLRASLALAYASRGKLEAFREAVKSAIEADPKSPAARMVQARLDAVEGRVPAALKLLDEVIADDPKRVSALLLRADFVMATGGKPDEVKAAYGKVLAVERTNLSAMAGLAQYAAQTQDWATAEAQYEALKKAHPKQLITTFVGALIDVQKGQLAAANEKALALLKVAPDDVRVNRLAGAIAFQRGKASQAAVNLGKAVALTGGSQVPLRVMLARAQLQMGEPQRALQTLRTVLDGKEVTNEVRLTAAEAHLQLGESAAASALFTKAAQADPSDARARTALVLSRAGTDPMASTEAALKQIGASDAGTLSEMALISVHLSKQQWAEALKAVDALEAKQPGKPISAMLRGRIELQRGDRALARKHFEAALARSADYVPAALALAKLEVLDGKREAATQRFQKLVDAKLGGVEAEMALVSLKTDAGAKTEELRTLLAEVVKRHPAEAQPRVALVKVHLQAGHKKEALSVAQDGASAFPTEPAFQEALSRVHQAAGDRAQAEAAANKMATLAPTSPVPPFRLAELSLAAGDLEATRQHLQRAVSLKPDYLPAQSALVNLHASRGQWAQARSVAQSVQKQRPQDPTGWLLLGDVERQARLPAPAAAAYREALKRGEDAAVAVSLYGALEASGARNEARQFYADWVAKHPKDVLVRMAAADRVMVEGKWADAEAKLEEILAIKPDNPISLNNLAWVQQQLGKPNALATAEKALKLQPNAAPFLDTYAAILAAQGKLDEAITTQRKSLEAEPGNALHRFHLAEMLAKAKKPDEARKELDELAKLGERFPRQADVKALRAQLGN